ncbi:FAD-dependent monooxygenase [Kutzneria viridogrisea]|uniref:2-polyprenyl-6-methoxyphenol hydroxylase-like FAD-dependent oxidoreductase n=1 Tax=Kutzneria viridogrisea TaxID=47990 RepID=A0ABR6BAS0_9PSEU|nr:2-polyprenyl-6-methoxyphenol hydroxylase-like FAD-dependent oxidoreductase [Kutzneria viridogrisea]
MSRRVLISGASIAGPALAFWLTRYGMTPTVVERFPRLRPGGQTVDLRGAGHTIVQRMGLEGEVRKRLTGERGVRFIGGDGRVKASLGADSFGGAGFVIDLELLRGELSEVLYDSTREDTEYLFGDEITSLDDTGDRVQVSFRNGPDREFDLVVLADGLRSRTRELVFADTTRIRSFGLYTAYFTIPRAESDSDWARWYNASLGRTVGLRPDNLGTTRALLSIVSKPRGCEKLTTPEQKRLLRRLFAGAGWETDRVLSGMDTAEDFYFEAIGQVRVDQWSRGRVALLGDAGYCASPISGMGTSLALVGAYVLAGELSRLHDHHAAFRSYETIMRPYVTQAQGVSSFAPRIAAPRSTAGIRLLHTALGLAASPAASSLFSRFVVPPADKIDLPDYAA